MATWMGHRNVEDLLLNEMYTIKQRKGRTIVSYRTTRTVMYWTLPIQQKTTLNNPFCCILHCCKTNGPLRDARRCKLFTVKHPKSSCFSLYLSLPLSFSLPSVSSVHYSSLFIRAVGERGSLSSSDFCFDTAILSSSHYFFWVSN